MSAIEASGADFFPILYEQISPRSELRQRVVEATKKRKFELNFQPQFSVKTKQLRGFEALLRWHDSELGEVSPGNFISAAEETYSIIDLGYWVLETAVKTLKHWQTEFAFDGIMAVNVSAVQLKQPDFAAGVFTILRRYEVSPQRLELEVTESILIDDMEGTVQCLNLIRQEGILISLDDFGTGFSSFQYLQQLPVTALKIDKSFISGLESACGKESAITEAIITLGIKLGLETIAEGVEKPAQMDILNGMGCMTVQGFLYGKTTNRHTCEALLKEKIAT
ncbi:MAG: EAL domain-containing protein [Treponema sp.]|jgi:EAL domain-containing protein (putative c-di-GMP-specific phosphodiesterase class I)|nr:EAL domain-containing protein [Treponema sp.]